MYVGWEALVMPLDETRAQAAVQDSASQRETKAVVMKFPGL